MISAPSPFLPGTSIQFAGSDEETYAKWLISKATVAGECWECHLKPNAKGYCYVQVGGRSGIKWRVHRLIWTVAKGEIEPLMSILHSCDNRRCIRLDHLFKGTDADNTQDMMNKGRHKFILPDNEKLTDEQMIHVKQLRDEGASYETIAGQFGVVASTIMNNLRRRG